MAQRVRVKDVINLAAPSSWAASVMPCVLATCVSYSQMRELPIDLVACLFAIAVLMQSAVNAFNDYADFVRGTDTLENSPDASDAVIVYGMSPKFALGCGIAFLASAMAFAPYVTLRCGPAPLLIGIVGAIVVVTYSFGKTPVSYLPLGELVSGLVMGGLIPLAGVRMLVGRLDFFVLVQALPVMVGISMIMFSNNGCDIERDIPAGRHTLPCMLGRRRTDVLYRVMLAVWTASPALLLLAQGLVSGAIVYCLEVPVMVFGLARQCGLQLGQELRMQVMAGIGNLNVTLGFAYCVALMVAM